MESKITNGRMKIYTDKEITKDNVIEVLKKTLEIHEQNRINIKYLLDFDKGKQDLVRKKTVRKDIDITSIANLANEITEFKLGYFWGNPVALVQKSDKLPAGSDKKADNSAITILNDMYYAEQKDRKDQELARYIEITGVGYQLIDIKRNPDEYDAPFDLLTLNPLFTYVVYSSDVFHKPVMGVTYCIKENFERSYTVYTKDRVFIINSKYKLINGKPIEKTEPEYEENEKSGEINPLNQVPIIEFERACDRTGCFERQISELNALNVLTSDFVNDVSQNTQAIWWGNDIKLEEDKDGNTVGVKGGQWILTNTNGQGQRPDIKPLTLQYDYSGIIQDICTQHDYILERAFVPKQSDPGGGSTGTAMSLSSGWSAAESVACKEALIVKKGFYERNKLVLKAIKLVLTNSDNPVLSLSPNDIEIRFIRQKTFDLATKVNALKVLLDSMVNPRVAMETVDLFGNLAEAVDDSIDNMDKYQENILKNKQEDSNKKEMQDLSDQVSNSPILKS